MNFDELGAPGSAAHFEPIAVSDSSTVVAEFVPDPSKESAYQSESELEAAFIRLLEGQAYEYLPITSAAALEANLRAQLEALNSITFSQAEWQRFFTETIAGPSKGRPRWSRRTTSRSCGATMGRRRTST